ncbi:hypothetical protein EJ04DRAFT_513498 [Polyplosphaeria fusca]|uniref:Uncharacterized protein n=1 Tax=Polyplosphaeria fusca TaxID=682080 RepID=A0A9P4QUR4_9PLEO|nr:hypothetical protein EJ04DRAFT_513498 [Polyplosphaeria fusca]
MQHTHTPATAEPPNPTNDPAAQTLSKSNTFGLQSDRTHPQSAQCFPPQAFLPLRNPMLEPTLPYPILSHPPTPAPSSAPKYRSGNPREPTTSPHILVLALVLVPHATTVS